MTEIHIHGIAGHKFGRFHKFVNINKATDCIKAIDANREGFMQYLISSGQKNQHYELVVDEEPLTSLNEAIEKRKIKRIDVVPVIKGQVNFVIQFVIQVLIQVVIAGIQYLMTPIPEEEPVAAKARLAPASYMFASRENVTAQYTPVPLGYGALRIGTKIIQSVIEPIDLSTNESRIGSDIVSRSISSLESPKAGGRGATYWWKQKLFYMEK